MRRVVLFLAMSSTLALAACGPVELRADANRVVYQYDPNESTLPDAAALAWASCAQYGKRAAFSELTDDGRYHDAHFDCLPQTAQAPPAMP
jgi:hypothetical protein